MPRKTVMTPTFVAKACALMKKEGVSVHAAARKMGCSPSTIMRCTGGKRAAQMGKRAVYLDRIENSRKASVTRSARKSNAKSAKAARPHGNTKRKLRAPKAA